MRDEGQGRCGQRQAATDDLEIIQSIAVCGYQRRDRLAEIDRRTAAERNHDIGLRRARNREPLLHHCERRFAGACERRDARAGSLQGIAQPCGALGRSPVDEEHAVSMSAHERSRFRRPAAPENDPPGGGEGEASEIVRHCVKVLRTASFQPA